MCRPTGIFPLSRECPEVRANRAYARIVDHQAKAVTTLEMSCSWIQNRVKKDEVCECVEVHDGRLL